MDTEKVKADKATGDEGKKPMKPWLRAALAIAAAVCLAGAVTGVVFLVRAGLSAITDYGGNTYGDPDYVPEQPPIKPVNDRLYFTADGQNTDITNMVDRDLPYVYPCTDSETGAPAQIIVGGDKEHYGYVRLVWDEEYRRWRGTGKTLDRSVFISVDVGEPYLPGPNYADRWYLVNDPVSVDIQYNISILKDDGELESAFHTHSERSIPENWEEDCAEAWLISALLQQELFELPEWDYSIINPVKLTDDGKVIFVAEGQETDITALISEDAPYIYRVKHSDEFGEDFDSYIFVGGSPASSGWALLCRMSDSMWIAAEENLTYIAAGMTEGEHGSERFRQWYLNGVEQIGYDQGKIMMDWAGSGQ